ncbi:MAG: HAD family hydrolase [Treponema sp.]|nr:HAD family hydrolase [Treponema sp.]
MKYKCVIFDCDGTLLDTLGDIAFAMNKALSLHGFPDVPQAQYRDMVGWGIYRLAELALPEESRNEANIKTLGDCASQLMQEQRETLTKPYPGMNELLIKLSNIRLPRGKKLSLSVLSNKPDFVLNQVVRNFFPLINFDAVYGMRPGTAPKPDPAIVWEMLAEIDCLPQDTIFAGDSEIDIETARNAGCFPLGVSWGFRPRETLVKSGAAKIINKPDELLELLEHFN